MISSYDGTCYCENGEIYLNEGSLDIYNYSNNEYKDSYIKITFNDTLFCRNIPYYSTSISSDNLTPFKKQLYEQDNLVLTNTYYGKFRNNNINDKYSDSNRCFSIETIGEKKYQFYGSFLDGKKHGNGTLKDDLNCLEIIANFKNDEIDGKFIYSDVNSISQLKISGSCHQNKITNLELYSLSYGHVIYQYVGELYYELYKMPIFSGSGKLTLTDNLNKTKIIYTGEFAYDLDFPNFAEGERKIFKDNKLVLESTGTLWC